MTDQPFQPWDLTHQPDPHPIYHQMRTQAPVYPATGPTTGRRTWFLTGHHDVQAVQRHPDIGRELAGLTDELAAPHRAAGLDPGHQLSRNLLNLDPPDHTRLRRLVAPAFGPRTVAPLAARIEEIVADLIEGMRAANGEVDLIEALALPLPVTVIAELLGIPIDDRHSFRTLVDRVLHGDGPDQSGFADFAAYLTERIEWRRRNPGEDLLSQLIEAKEAGDRLTHSELLATAFLLLIAGHETTVNLIGNGVLELLRHAPQLRQLRTHPALIDSAVEEILRYRGPVERGRHLFTLADVELAGVRIPRGEVLIPVLAAANRDPAVFEAPDTFDITRQPNRHVGFGHAAHFCLGAPLARLEGKVAISALVQQFPNLSLAIDPTEAEWTNGNAMLRGLRRLPVRPHG